MLIVLLEFYSVCPLIQLFVMICFLCFFLSWPFKFCVKNFLAILSLPYLHAIPCMSVYLILSVCSCVASSKKVSKYTEIIGFGVGVSRACLDELLPTSIVYCLFLLVCGCCVPLQMLPVTCTFAMNLYAAALLMIYLSLRDKYRLRDSYYIVCNRILSDFCGLDSCVT